jgi:hypothetical protein
MTKNNFDFENLKTLIGQFHAKVKEVTQIAIKCQKGGNVSWFELIKKYNIEPIPENQKNLYYSQGIPIEKGAFPSELRLLFQSLRFEVISNLQQSFPEDELSDEASEQWDDFMHYLRDFIEREMSNYLSEIKQKVSVSNIFANAFSGMNKFSGGLKESNLNTKQCKNCGSPRLDNDQYETCYFCGTPLFETVQIETKCKKCGSPKFAEDQGKACRFCGN